MTEQQCAPVTEEECQVVQETVQETVCGYSGHHHTHHRREAGGEDTRGRREADSEAGAEAEDRYGKSYGHHKPGYHQPGLQKPGYHHKPGLHQPGYRGPGLGYGLLPPPLGLAPSLKYGHLPAPAPAPGTTMTSCAPVHTNTPPSRWRL